ncbi:D-alanyl-D-alanine carboxypeptidase [Vibrio sinensis]|uniref:serine-type D-Ala-D-Ala carboxypeptidase n=1 Tax=Vibrio sinensis TaxID=2302434 RepID=A0A3A6QIK3_9VIBR|nr:D-alanyl-D-alanine carboxypeptidase family protein [Vibrio sinensis]RJX66529.1 D-alanyl-D-alanine carboxypeptidase [Vibrio sinensis]
MNHFLLRWIAISLLYCAPVYAVVTPNPPDLPAKGYILIDYQSGMIIAEKNSRAALAPASLTKLMTAYVIGQEIKAERLGWQDIVTISENAWSEKFPDSSKMFIQPGDNITIANLLRGVIIQSGNDACVALAEHVAGSEGAFVALMNGWAKKLGMQDTYFVNAHGLDADLIQTSPSDMAILMKSVISDVPDVYKIYNEKMFRWNKITQYNRNKLLWDKSLAVDGGKTGYTNNAGYSLVSSATEGRMRLISVVMGTSSKQSRVTASKNLLSYGFRFFDTKKVGEKGRIESKVRVWKGDVNEVNAEFIEDAYLTLPRSMSRKLERKVLLDQPILAPLAQGDVIGKVIWTSEGETVASMPLVTNQAVEKASWFGLLWDSVILWFGQMIATVMASTEVST